ncbi:hypothetical protein SAMN04488137_1013 [Fictibacillus solisalsi]|uniref:Uncharacterized protein n=2 Tax=Fictibacillus solisalsi TaxID=459525 RepID=A0A1G9UM85_9BACL|nr:hypothetical protein SAMN04488137_1013 [Fictibacillus solisalsi]
MNKIKRVVFGEKKMSELESLQAEVQINESAIQEEAQKQQRLNEGLRLLNIELEVAPDDKDLLKRKKRLETALNESQERASEATTRKEELEGKISNLSKEKRLAHLHELAEQDVEGFERGRRATVIKEEIRKLMREIESRDGLWGYSKPERLHREFGIDSFTFDKNNPAHDDARKIWETQKGEAEERIQKEAQQVIDFLKKYLGGFDN